jgi:hypothetical protein
VVSTSKMPPQQSKRLLDVVDEALGFRAHRASPWPPRRRFDSE